MLQQSKEWLEWRKKGIGASDAPVVMKVSPWKTPYQLWEEKTGKVQEPPANEAMMRGNRLEPKARSTWELMSDCEMPACLAEHARYPFIRASLDGLNLKSSRILEIKCPNLKDHQLAIEGKVPEKYFPQLQHQLLVTNVERAIYYSYSHNDETGQGSGVAVEVLPDKEYQEMLLEKEIEFWEKVTNDEPPEFIEKDFRPIDDLALISLLESYEEKISQAKGIEAQLEEIKSRIKTLSKGQRLGNQRYKIATISRKGSIDYSKIEALKSIDLEMYRKKGSSYLRIDIK